MRRAVVILPTYNEAANIQPLIERIFQVAQTINARWELHVAVVDSDSPDKTGQIVKDLISQYPKLHLITTKKEGLGKAYTTGFKTVMETLQPYVLFEMDADLSHDPQKIPVFLQEIEKGADFVIGSRYRRGGSIPKDWGIDRKIFSISANLIIRLGFMKPHITEWTNGYRAIKTWIIKKVLPQIQNYSGYVFQVALLDNAIKSLAVIREVPIHFVDRKNGVSKINSFQYIVQTFFYVFTHSPFIKYVIVGFIGFVIDFLFAYLFIHFLHIAKVLANTFSAEIAIIFNFLMNNFWSFKHKKIVGGMFAYLKKFIFFNVVTSGSIIIQAVGMAVSLALFGDRVYNLLNIISIQGWIIYKVFIIAFLIIPYSYFMYNKMIWKEK